MSSCPVARKAGSEPNRVLDIERALLALNPRHGISVSRMTSFRFEVEWISSAPLSTVMARRLDQGDFRIDEDSTLHGCPVLGMQMPLALDRNGKRRFDLFAFHVEPESLPSFNEGDVVVLDAKALRATDPER